MLTRQNLLLLAAVVVCLLGGGRCWGYVLCPEHILFRMLNKMGPSSGFTVEQSLFLDNIGCDDVAEDVSRIRETTWYHPPGKFRSEVLADEGRRLYLSSGDEAVTIAGEKVVGIRQNDLMAYYLPLAFRDWQKLAEALAARGVDLTVSSLGRHGEEVSFVIGARYPDLSVPQLWVDKETFLPKRFFVAAAGGEPSLLEFSYQKWRRMDGAWYPMRIEVCRQGLVERVVCAYSRQKVSSFASDFFDIQAIKSAYPSVDAEEPGKGEEADREDEVQRTIDDFRKLYQP